MINIFSKKIKNKGFTLIEMLVAISIFMSVMVIAMGSLISIINANKKSQAIKSVVDNVTFVLDSISRKVELGKNYMCDSSTIIQASTPIPNLCGGGGSCACPSGGTAIQYYNKNIRRLVQYAFVKNPNLGDGNIQQRVCSDDSQPCNTWKDASIRNGWQNLTGPVSNVNIKRMTFYVLGIGTENAALGDRRQPRIIITAEGSAGTGDTESSFVLQTSVSKAGRGTLDI